MIQKPFLNTKQLASRWDISISILKQWRLKGKGPQFVKVESRVRYYLHHIEQYEKERVMQHTSMY